MNFAFRAQSLFGESQPSHMCRVKSSVIAISVIGALFAASSASAGPLVTELVSVNPATGVQADGNSTSPVLSDDGCIVAFVSQSGTLAPASYGLTNASPKQIYAVDRCATPHTIELISVTNDGSAAGDGLSDFPNISGDGRYVAFMSTSGNLPVPNSAPLNKAYFLFVRDRLTQTTTSPLEQWRVKSNTNASIGYQNTPHRYMSSDASRFALEFYNSVSVPSNLYQIDVSGGGTALTAICPTAAAMSATSCNEAQISSDGSKIAFDTDYPIVASDVNNVEDVFSYDVTSTASSLVSVTAIGDQANHSVFPYGDLGLSADGHLVVFSTSEATNFPGNTANTLVSKNMTTGEVILLTAASDGSAASLSAGVAAPSISADGNRVAFTEDNPVLSPWLQTFHPDGLVVDFALGHRNGVCVSSSGSYGKFGCDSISISGDGKWAAFRSISPNLVPGDINTIADIFVVSLDPAMDDMFASGFEP